MTIQRLTEIQQRLDAATPGPWRSYFGGEETCIGSDNPDLKHPTVADAQTIEDARFIAYARVDVQELLDEIKTHWSEALK